MALNCPKMQLGAVRIWNPTVCYYVTRNEPTIALYLLNANGQCEWTVSALKKQVSGQKIWCTAESKNLTFPIVNVLLLLKELQLPNNRSPKFLATLTGELYYTIKNVKCYITNAYNVFANWPFELSSQIFSV